MVGGYKKMLQSVHLSVCLSSFQILSFHKRWYACVATSVTFDRGQHSRLYLRPNAINQGILLAL